MTSRKDKFESRFREHYSRLCHLAYGYVADRDECEDMVQEVFISVWNSGKDSLPEDEFAAYVTTALRNRCISFLRKKCNAAVSFEDLSVLPAMEDDVADHEGEQRSLTDFLQEVLSVLPPKCREVFLLAKQQDMKYREIAQALDISEKTVENQMTKAIRLLRQYVKENPYLWLCIGWICSMIANITWK